MCAYLCAYPFAYTINLSERQTRDIRDDGVKRRFP